MKLLRIKEKNEIGPLKRKRGSTNYCSFLLPCRFSNHSSISLPQRNMSEKLKNVRKRPLKKEDAHGKDTHG